MAYLRLSSTCQQVVIEDLQDISSARLIIRSCFSNPDLWPAIAEHKCNGTALVPAGLYTDMAWTAARYIWQHFRPSKTADSPSSTPIHKPGINVFEMEVHKPFIANLSPNAAAQWVEMEVMVIPSTSLPSAPTTPNPVPVTPDFTNSILKCTFHSLTPSTSPSTPLIRLQTHGHCLARWEDEATWLRDWAPHTAAILTAMQNLETRALVECSDRSGSGGNGHGANGSAGTGRQRGVNLVYRDRAYALFRSFVDYGPVYRNMQKVVFDRGSLEATAELEFGGYGIGSGIDDGGDDEEMDMRMGRGPFYMDGSCHVSGFVCNAVEQDSDRNAFISHGISGMKLSSRFRPGRAKELRNYVRMESMAGDGSVMVGDVWVVQDGEIVGIWERVRFKKIPRRVLNVFLPPPRKQKA